MKFWHVFKTASDKFSASFWGVVSLVSIFLSLSLGQLGRIEYGLVLYPHDILIGLFLISQRPVLTSVVNDFFISLRSKKHRLMLIFLCWLMVGMLLTTVNDFNINNWLYLGRVGYYLLFVVVLRTCFSQKPRLLRSLITVSGLYMVWFGLLQYLLLPDTRFLYIQGWDEHYYRLIGTILDPNFSGIIFVVCGWLLISLKQRVPIMLWSIAIALCIAATALTFSRATYLALGMSVLVYLLRSANLKNISRYFTAGLIVMGLFLTSLYFAPKPGGEGVNLLRTESITARYTASAQFLTSLTPLEWITGKGLYFEKAGDSHAKAPDNVIVLLLSSTGIFGTILVIVWFVKQISQLKALEPEATAVLVAVIVHAQFNNTLLEPFVLLYSAIGLSSFVRVKESS